MNEENEWKTAKQGEMFKLEQNVPLEGTFQGYEQSSKFEDSYVLNIKVHDKITSTFVSKIVIDLLEKNNILKDQEIRLTFVGMKKSEAGREYKDYVLQYK